MHPNRARPANSRHDSAQNISPEEQMRQLREALASAGPLPSLPSSEDGDPLAALMANMAQPRMPGMSAEKAVMAKPKTRLQKLMPFIHLLACWALLGYFVIWREPESYESRTHHSDSESFWRRWAELGWKSAEEGWGVQPIVSCNRYHWTEFPS